MGKLILITGGARSGKSTYAERMAGSISNKVLYLATAVAFDEEMKHRIEKHKQSRPAFWDTQEGYKNLNIVIEEASDYEVVLLDCITVMLTNLLWEYPGMDFDTPSKEDLEKAEEYVRIEFDKLLKSAMDYKGTLIMVTNELGSGIVPEAPIARSFRDIAGRVNQQIAAHCQEVYLTVCGIPVQIKKASEEHL
ncbi:MAG: bifunctional adenosylcobinamide kinase/adenosylcobinamide-phosphate guanylyltransferase [Clostridiales bacterium GWB2_37_7]|nr:MAG: bifunctional adenosylcobinamide kinase/adenosylcobinamide-phosphate guanylyltransferase [Clostridiales bacterium GWB2_37_7]